MKSRPLVSFALSVVFLMQPLAGRAFETDQYNLPPVPLADIGIEVSGYVELNLRAAVVQVNADILKSMACLEAVSAADKLCGSHDEEDAKLGYLRSNDAVAHELFKRVGDGNLMFTKFGKWMNSHEFKEKPSSYKTSYGRSIYIAAPFNYLTISPTVRLFGTEFGVDKLEHFFQQGYKYYRIRRESLAGGLTQDKSEAKAVKWGQKTERTYYGLMVSGVYSNADLYANYAGMKFYLGLTEPVKIGELTRPATLSLQNGTWKLDDDATTAASLLKPFLTEHLNEALNPSGYAFTIYSSVRHMVRKYSCPQWRQKYPDLTPDVFDKRSTDLELWNDEDYGNMPGARAVRISDVCFSDKLRTE